MLYSNRHQQDGQQQEQILQLASVILHSMSALTCFSLDLRNRLHELLPLPLD